MIEKLKQEIRVDEGCVFEIYKCSAGMATFGIGHMVTCEDPEYGHGVHTPVSPMRVEQAFEKDVEIALIGCNQIFPEFENYPEEVQKICANMMFQLGFSRFRGFKHMIAAVKNKNWSRAADEMRDSLWNKQTHARSERLISRMKSINK